MLKAEAQQMPLSGIRVIDFGKYIAGPYVAALLADYGADVIRVEMPGGNDDRFTVPVAADGSGAMFMQMNRSKRSLTLKPGTPEGREVVRRLVASADVVVANLPHDVLTRLGLDYGSVAAVNPRAILATSSAFGTTGPWAGKVGFDSIGQVMSGTAFLTGTPEQPHRSQANYVDFTTALHCAFGVMVALRERDTSGLGQEVSGSLLASALTVSNALTIDHCLNGIDRQPLGNRSFSSAPTDLFRTSDGWIMTHIVGEAIFSRWATLVCHPEFVGEVRFSSDLARGDNGEYLSQIMSDWCQSRTTEEAIEELASARVPAAPLLQPKEVLDHPQVQGMRLFEALDYPGADKPPPIIRAPITLSRSEKAPAVRAPKVGEHSEEILSELGLGETEIARLRDNGIT